VECDLCGCGDRLKNEETLLGTLLPPDPYSLINLVDVVPAPAKKERNLHGSAYITFVVDRWEVKPDYMNNHRELRKITDTLDVMVADPNVSVRQVKIHGFASPESPYEHNRMLATNRAKSLTDYVSHLYNLPANVFAPAEATPENWEGLRRAVVEMDEQTLPHRQQILTTIDRVLADISNGTTTKADRDEHSIRDTYPDEYRLLLRDVYPTLRRSDYDISFNFSDFTLEQAKEIYKKRPYQLSLRELWDVAQTMEPNSPEYNKVLQQAVNIYPDDPVANLNLANVAIRQKDLLKAETLLERAGDSAEAQNTRAVLAILQQRYADAEALLQKAAQLELDVTKNREAIKTLTK
jgi:tetratricopeptide (TPR) repeat protein